MLQVLCPPGSPGGHSAIRPGLPEVFSGHEVVRIRQIGEISRKNPNLTPT